MLKQKGKFNLLKVQGGSQGFTYVCSSHAFRFRRVLHSFCNADGGIWGEVLVSLQQKDRDYLWISQTT